MKKVWLVIGFATLYLIFYQMTPYIGVPEEIIIALYIFSPFVIIYMVYVVLKEGTPSKFTFDERFYDDFDYRRSNSKE